MNVELLKSIVKYAVIGLVLGAALGLGSSYLAVQAGLSLGAYIGLMVVAQFVGWAGLMYVATLMEQKELQKRLVAAWQMGWKAAQEGQAK